MDIPGQISAEIDILTPLRRPPVRGVISRDKAREFVNFPMRFENDHWDDVSSDDYVTLFTQYSTQWDAFSHVGRHFDVDGDGKDEVIYYNGFRGGVDVIGSENPEGPKALHLGIERMAETCVQGRGVLIDLHHHFGSQRRLVNMDDLERVMDSDEVTVETGDMLCLHTGYGQAIMDMGANPTKEVLHGKYAVLDGRDDKLLSWIASSGISVLIADNFAVEGFPYADRSDCDHYHGLPIHQKCLVDLGVHLGEIWYLTP
jgi:hypothetical protein